MKKALTVSEEISVEQYKRELIAEIKKAYYSVGMTEELVNMLKNTRLVLLENIRVNQKLVENSKVTRDVLLRSQTELSSFDQQLQEAIKNRLMAGAYFNFLLNRPLNDSIIIEDPVIKATSANHTLGYSQQAIANREEIMNLEQYLHISELAIDMNQSAKLPDVMVVADYGFQGEKYAFNKDHDYMQASVVLTWNLFEGMQNRAKIKQAILEKERIEHQLNEAKNQITLQVINAVNEVKTSEAGLVAAESQVKTAREGFRLVKRKYEEGQAGLIEFMDARNTLTRAEKNLIISQYTCLSHYAELEKVIAGSNP
jgi:outer membrane protein